MDHKDFDDKISKQLGATQEFPFDENQWEQLAVQLDEKKEKRRPLGWWFWGSAAAVAFILGFAYYSFLLNQKIDQLEQKVEQFAKAQEPTITTGDPKAIEKVIPRNTVLNEKNEDGEKEKNSTPRELFSIDKAAQKQPIANVNQLPERKIATPNIEYIAPQINGLNPITIAESIVKKEKPAVEEATISPLIEKEEIRTNLLVFNLLNVKNEVIVFEENPEFDLEQQRFKKPLKFRNWSLGAYASAGWKVESSNTKNSGLRSEDELIEVADLVTNEFNPETLYAGSLSTDYKINISQFGLKAVTQFTHGISLHTSFGLRKILIEGPGYSLPAAISDNFKNDNDRLNSIEIRQNQWVLGLGLGYSPFTKWKVRPYVEITPEFSSTVVFNQDFLVEEAPQPPGLNGEPANSSTGVFYDLNYSNANRGFKLRNISNVIGVEGTLGENLYWQVNGGMNWSVTNSSPSILNRYKVGFGLGYNF